MDHWMQEFVSTGFFYGLGVFLLGAFVLAAVWSWRDMRREQREAEAARQQERDDSHILIVRKVR